MAILCSSAEGVESGINQIMLYQISPTDPYRFRTSNRRPSDTPLIRLPEATRLSGYHSHGETRLPPRVGGEYRFRGSPQPPPEVATVGKRRAVARAPLPVRARMQRLRGHDSREDDHEHDRVGIDRGAARSNVDTDQDLLCFLRCRPEFIATDRASEA